MQKSIENNQERLSDQEKLKQVKEFIKEAYKFWIEYWERNIKQWNKELNILDASVDGTWSKIHFYIEKNWDKVFEFNLDESNSIEKWKTRTTWVTMEIDWKKMSYSWNHYDEHWIYNNFHLLDWAKKYLKEAQDMIILDKAKRNKEQEIKKTTQEYKSDFDKLQSSIN